jgi:3-methyladenine DNA glycosylase AlkD
MALAATLLDRLTTAFEAAADPAAAVPMRAYMRDQFDYLGLRMPAQRRLARQAARGLPAPGQADLAEFARACWAQPFREYQYAACDYLRRHVGVCGPDFLPVVRELIEAKSWWDTVDTLAADVVGPLVLQHPELALDMDEWVADGYLWIIRTAILHQLTYARRTDTGRLFGYCAQQAGHPDFFIRKAIGWALRQYARTDPAAVASFVARTPLSGLSRREALRHIGAG